VWATRPNLMTQHAQIAEHKYSRPHARPFRLRFARVVAVFSVCSPATLQALRRPRPSTLELGVIRHRAPVPVGKIFWTALSERRGALEFCWAANPETGTFGHEPALVGRTCSPAKLLGYLKFVSTPRCNDARRRRPCGRRRTGRNGLVSNQRTAPPGEMRQRGTALHVWMAPAWQEIIWRAAQRSLAVMCPAC
jgi:hypothetical protein